MTKRSWCAFCIKHEMSPKQSALRVSLVSDTPNDVSSVSAPLSQEKSVTFRL